MKDRNRRKRMAKNLLKKKSAEYDAIEKSFVQFTNKERTCNKCGMCCIIYGIALTHGDLDREPKLTGASRPIEQSEREKHNIDDKYRRMINTTGSNQRCHFYKDGFGCSIYENRPEICRNYIPTLSNCLKARMGHVGFNIEALNQRKELAC